MAEEHIAWLDLETTGLLPASESLLQVAMIVTDSNLDPVHEGFMVKVHYTEEQVQALRSKAVPFVQEMHDSNGLWASLPTEGLPLSDAEAQILDYIDSLVPASQKPRLGGNSITLDRSFLGAFMPRVLGRLHYRSLDMTSVGGFLALARPDFEQFQKQKTHDAMDDIRESLAEARHYRDLLKLASPLDPAVPAIAMD